MRDASDLIKSGIEALKRDPVTLTLVSLGWFLFGTGGAGSSGGHATGFTFVAAPYDLLIGSVVVAGAGWAHLQAARGRPANFADIFRGFTSLPRYFNNVLVSLALGFSVAFGLALCVLPGIYLAIRLAFSSLLVNDRELGAIEAMQESWRLTKGREMDILMFYLASALVVLVGLCACIIGVVPAVTVVLGGFSALYDDVSRARNEADETMTA